MRCQFLNPGSSFPVKWLTTEPFTTSTSNPASRPRKSTWLWTAVNEDTETDPRYSDAPGKRMTFSEALLVSEKWQGHKVNRCLDEFDELSDPEVFNREIHGAVRTDSDE